MNSLDYIVNKVLDVIKRDTKKKTSSYDAVGTVTRVEDNIAWVHFDNGVSETPVVMSIHCNKGDKVHVRVTSGTAFITGNETAPPSDDTEALVAKALAKLADSKAESAEATAADAQETAEKAANTAGTSLVTDTMHYIATTLSSGVTTSTPGWTTTVQSIDATNKYLWTYHTYTKANESSIDTTPVLTGRYGEDGTSVSILGSYSTYADLVAAHPTGNTGEAYMVGNDLYVWNGTAWEDVGQIKGDTGVGVASIAKTGTSGLVDTYTITYTDNSTSTYTVTNGQKGDTGAAGANGKTPYIQSGYWYIDGTSTGVKAEGDDGNTPYIQSGYWYINGTSTGIKAEGTNGTSVTAVQPQYYNHTSPTATQQEIDSWQWSTTLTYEAGKYIWTRDLVSYSNSTTTTSTAIYNEALTTACADAVSALEMAQNVNQHFWNETSGTEAGAHITEVSQEEWSDSTSANYHTGANLLLRSNTIKLRNALVTLMELTDTELTFYDANGEKRAEFGTNGLYLYGKKVTGSFSFMRMLAQGMEFCYNDTGTVRSSAKLGNDGFGAFMYSRYQVMSSSVLQYFRSVLVNDTGFHITHDRGTKPESGQTNFVETAYLKDGEARVATADNTGSINSYTDIKPPRLDGDHIFRAHSVNNTDVVDVTYDGTNDKAVLLWNGQEPFKTYTVTGTDTVNANSGKTISCTTGTLPTGYTAIGIVGVSTNNELVTSIDRFVLATGGASVTVRNHSSTNRSMTVTVTILCTALA